MTITDVYFILSFMFLHLAKSQDYCSLADQDIVEMVYLGIANVSEANITRHYFPCSAQANIFENYRQLSVVVVLHDNNGTNYAQQFEMDCDNGAWKGRENGDLKDIHHPLNNTQPDIILKTGCSSCNSSAGNEYHCIECNYACNSYSKTCTGPGPDECCPVFNNATRTCSHNCSDAEFVASELTGYLCSDHPGCFLPDDDEFSSIIPDITDIIDGPYYTCLTQGLTKDKYYQFTAVVVYRNAFGQLVGQFDSSCYLQGWKQQHVPGDALPGTSYNRSTIEKRTDCAECSGKVPGVGENHCVACDPLCNKGLMRCVDDMRCCVAYEENGDCKPNLECSRKNYVANQENNFTCSCGISSCSEGYYFEASTCTCLQATDICGTANPCNNGGTCVLRSSPNNYSCICLNEYSGINCTECSLECLNGGTVDDQCHSCNCDSGYAGGNCSECGSGYHRDNTTSKCVPDDGPSFKWWYVVLPILLLLVIVIIIIIIIVVILIATSRLHVNMVPFRITLGKEAELIND